MESYDAAAALRPTAWLPHNNKGLTLIQAGRIREGAALLERAIEQAPQCAEAYYNLSLSRQFEAGDAAIGAMQELAQRAAFSDPRDAIKLNFALGKAFDDVGDYPQAFIYFSAGNEYKRRALPYDEPGVVGRLVRTRWAYTADFIRKRSEFGYNSEVPIFIIGMPRSGSTLVEQILSNHRAVHGAGEIDHFDAAAAELGGAVGETLNRPEFVAQFSSNQFSQLGASYVQSLRATAPAASWIINKTLDNYRQAGLIAITLPRARIIHVQRDPIDTCLSCFSTLFSENIPFAYDLAELGRYYRAYDILMAHWRAVLPEAMMLEVQYEDVISDLEGQARRIVNHCHLDWDPNCLEFHRNARIVRTASLAQVRRPLYKSSVGRWRAYERFLGPLLSALGPSVPRGAS